MALTKQLQSQRTFCTWFSRTRFDMNKPKRKCSLLLEVAIPNIPEIKIRLAIKVTGKWMDLKLTSFKMSIIKVGVILSIPFELASTSPPIIMGEPMLEKCSYKASTWLIRLCFCLPP